MTLTVPPEVVVAPQPTWAFHQSVLPGAFATVTPGVPLGMTSALIPRA